MIEDAALHLERLITEHLERDLADVDSVGISYSGGLDSSVAAILCSRIRSVKLYVVGTEGSQDVVSAKAGSALLGFALEQIIITGNDVRTAIPAIIELLNTRNALEISIELALLFVCNAAAEELILTGSGADELFGGYSRYLNQDVHAREERMRQDVAHCVQYKLPQERKIAESTGKRLISAYLAPEIIDYMQSLPMELKIRNKERKYLLRVLAGNLGIPSEIADRPKKAVQYGSGILKLMRSLAKREGLEIHEYLDKL